MRNYPIGNTKAYEILEASVSAYTYCFVDALTKAGVKHGITKEQAEKIAVQLLLGSSKLVSVSSEHPWELVDRVCSPAGTTIEGVASLQSDSFESKITQAFDSAF